MNKDQEKDILASLERKVKLFFDFPTPRRAVEGHAKRLVIDSTSSKMRAQTSADDSLEKTQCFCSSIPYPNNLLPSKH